MEMSSKSFSFNNLANASMSMRRLTPFSDSLLAELEQANEYVIGVPMHNFGVPSA